MATEEPREKWEEHSTSVVRLTFLPDHRDKIGVSEQWYQAMNSLKQQPNFSFVAKGESIDDELDIILFIAWGGTAPANPAASFLSGDLDCIFSPLDAFVVKKPYLMCNLYHMGWGNNQSSSWDTTRMGFNYISEFMIIRGPAQATNLALEEIKLQIDGYNDARHLAIDCNGYACHDWLLMHAFYARVGKDCEKRRGTASFLLDIAWRGRDQRREYQDPTIPDRTLPPETERFYPSDFWQKKFVERLESVGATTSSWTYHKAEVVRDREGYKVVGG
ncbi:hypothetical protein THAR02_05176 [Trichoderma harzianum]|uniref:Uncharacterized protein n=1 Tax=Trichoderma harzianum TaxID=5544 RepID=A0A0F9XR72_TRIHA|nr:hypothetical protein THAR02_05176 [Trichoderma harzianum]